MSCWHSAAEVTYSSFMSAMMDRACLTEDNVLLEVSEGKAACSCVTAGGPKFCARYKQDLAQRTGIPTILPAELKAGVLF